MGKRAQKTKKFHRAHVAPVEEEEFFSDEEAGDIAFTHSTGSKCPICRCIYSLCVLGCLAIACIYASYKAGFVSSQSMDEWFNRFSNTLGAAPLWGSARAETVSFTLPSETMESQPPSLPVWQSQLPRSRSSPPSLSATPPTPTTSWEWHEGSLNCYYGHGALGSASEEHTSTTLDECKEECVRDADCEAIVVQFDDPAARSGPLSCWHRGPVNPKLCQPYSGFELYTLTRGLPRV